MLPESGERRARCHDPARAEPAMGGRPFDWLFCDMVEEPHHVLRDIVDGALGQGESHVAAGPKNSESRAERVEIGARQIALPQ